MTCAEMVCEAKMATDLGENGPRLSWPPPSLRRHGRLPERVGGTASHPRTIETMGTGRYRAGSGPKWLEPKWLRTRTHSPPGGWWWFNLRMAGVPVAVAQAWW